MDKRFNKFYRDARYGHKMNTQNVQYNSKESGVSWRQNKRNTLFDMTHYHNNTNYSFKWANILVCSGLVHSFYCSTRKYQEQQERGHFPHVENLLNNPAVVLLQRLLVGFGDINPN